MNLQLPASALRLLLIVPAVITFLGLQSVYVYFANPKPLEISIDQLTNNPPRAKWIRITGGRINLIEAVVAENEFTKDIESLYIPIHPEGRDEAVVSVLLLSSDPELLALSRQFRVLDESPTGEADALKAAIENRHVILQNRTFEGLVQFGLKRDDRLTYQVRKALPEAVREPIIIEEGKKPSIVEGVVALIIAFVLGYGILKSSKTKKVTPPPLPRNG